VPPCFAYLKAALLARSQYASGRPSDRPTQPRFSVAFLCPGSKKRVPLHASYVAIPKLTPNFPPKCIPTKVIKISSRCTTPNTKSSPNTQILPSAAYCSSLLSLPVPHQIPNPLPCLRDSVVSIATHYGLDGLGIQSRWRRDFPPFPRQALGPTQPPVQWMQGHFP
jgi:hypothetical protein